MTIQFNIDIDDSLRGYHESFISFIVSFILFSVNENEEAEAGQDSVFEFGIIVHQNSHDAHVRDETTRTPDHVLLGQPKLTRRVQSTIVDGVVVSLGQELERTVFFLVDLDDSMDDGDFSAFDLEDDDLADSDGFLAMIGEEKQIASMESRLHGSRQHHHDRRLASRHHHQSLPYHECGGHDHSKVENLIVQLSLIHPSDIVEEVH